MALKKWRLSVTICVLLSLVITACSTTSQPLRTNTLQQPIPTQPRLPKTTTNTPTVTPTSVSVLGRTDAPPEGVSAQLEFMHPTATCTPDPKRGSYCTLRMEENELTSTEILRKFTVCFVEFTPNSEVLIQVTKPNGEVAETGTISTDASGEGWWDYRILSGEPLGIYKITLAQGNSRTEGAIEIVPATYPRMILLSPRDGSPGDSFLFSFAGFQPNQSLYLWHEVNYSEGWIYWTTLPQPAVDERGEGIYTLHTLPNDPTGCYMVSTDGHGSIYSDPVFCIW